MVSRIINIVLFVLFFQNGYSQNITLNDLVILLNKKNTEEANKVLVSKNFHFYNSDKGDHESFDRITYAFEKSYYDDKAQMWCYVFAAEDKIFKIGIDFRKVQFYTSILREISKNGYVLKNNLVEDETVITTYENKDYIIDIKKTKFEEYDYSEANFTGYVIYISKKSYDFQKNGFKKYFDEEGNLLSTYNLKDGKFHGELIIFYPSGVQKEITNYVDGVKEGKYTSFYEDGTLQTEGTIVKGAKHGVFTTYYEDDNLDLVEYKNGETTQITHIRNTSTGKRIQVGAYVNFQKEGLFKIYNDQISDDNLIGYENYLNGELNGKALNIIKNEIILSEYKNDELNGLTTFYIRDESFRVFDPTDALKILSETNFKDNQKHGVSTFYDAFGKIFSQGNFENDEKEGIWLDINKQDNTHIKSRYSIGKLEGIREILTETDELMYRDFYKNDKWLSSEYYEDGVVNKKLRVVDRNDHHIKVLCEDYTLKVASISMNAVILNQISETSDLNKNSEVYSNLNNVPYLAQDYFFNLESKSAVGYKQGIYEIIEFATGRMVIRGAYERDLKEGVWVFNDYDQGIVISEDYRNGLVEFEKYSTLSGAPFSGTYEYVNKEKGYKEERKIKKGLRHGKTIKYSLNDNKKIEKTSYKEGIFELN